VSDETGRALPDQGASQDVVTERLLSGTLLEDLGCPHCGKVCDVCVDADELLAALRAENEALRGALSQVQHASRPATYVNKTLACHSIREIAERALASDEKGRSNV
jgi:hypothetical protein